MQTLLSKALVASVTVAGLGLLAAPQAQAASFAIDSTANFFGGGTLTTDNFTATGFSANIPAAVNPTSRVLLQEESSSVVSLLVNLVPAAQPSLVPLPINFSYSYTITSLGQPFTIASANLNPSLAATTQGTLTKNVYDVQGGTLLGSATLTQNGLISTSVPLNLPSGYTSLFIEDEVSITKGGVASLTNTYQVPEPLTMLGASAAVAFGAAFKRRKATKG